MEVSTSDPFPWPDDQLCVEFGRTSYYAHKLEREFKLLLLAAQIGGRIQIPYDTAKYPSLEAFLYSQTLGGLIYILRQGGGLTDRNLKREVYGALNARNVIAHTALENHDPMRYTEQDRQALIRQFGELRLKIGVPYLLIRALRKAFQERVGITEKQLQARVMEGQHDEGDT